MRDSRSKIIGDLKSLKTILMTFLRFNMTVLN